MDTIFMSSGSLRTLSIPVTECIQAPFSLTAEVPQPTMDLISNKIRTIYEPAGDIIVRPLGSGKYEVLSGWHEVMFWNAIHPDKHIPVKSGVLSDAEAISIAVRVPYESSSLDCTKLWLSRAVKKAKQYFDLTDMNLSRALGKGYSRSSVNHLINLSRLSPDTEEAFLSGAVKSHHLKHLCTLSFSKQAQHIESLKSDSSRSIPSSNKAINELCNVDAYTESIDIDSKRFARDLSEKLGAPSRLLTGPNEKKRLEFDFYDFSELEGIAEKLATSNAKIKGRIVFDVEDSNGFTPIVDALFDEEM